MRGRMIRKGISCWKQITVAVLSRTGFLRCFSSWFVLFDFNCWNNSVRWTFWTADQLTLVISFQSGAALCLTESFSHLRCMISPTGPPSSTHPSGLRHSLPLALPEQPLQVVCRICMFWFFLFFLYTSSTRASWGQKFQWEKYLYVQERIWW